MDLRKKISPLKLQGVFITGTHTGIGKTYFTYHLAKSLHEAGYPVQVIKPIASGADFNQAFGGLQNEDALLFSSLFPDLPYELINPICFKPAIAPHIAAQDVGYDLSVEDVNYQVSNVIKHLYTNAHPRYLLVEGAGGWKTPLNHQETYADWVLQSGLSTIVVVGMELGCLNHAMLTCDAILSAGGQCKGWIANSLPSEMDRLEENIDTLKQVLPVPLLGVMDSSFDYSSLHSLF